MGNTVAWIEIPATDIHRACKFYSILLGASIQPSDMGGSLYAFLPGNDGGITQAPNFKPGQEGILVHLSAGEDLSPMLARVEEAGGKVVQPKTDIGGDMGFYALFLDSEGNRVGLYSPH
jgi:Predicted enzyme related to lactoylglutathione lyase